MSADIPTQFVGVGPSVDHAYSSVEITSSETAVYRRDPLFYRMVVSFLGATLILCVCGAGIALFMHRPVPQVFTALGSAAIGAFAGVFADVRHATVTNPQDMNSHV